MKLDEFLEEFRDVDPEEALEILIEFSDRLPPLSSGRTVAASPECRINECQTPVYLWVNIAEGAVQLEAHVPEKSPTVRGFVAMLVEGLSGEPVDSVLRMPDDLLPQLGLAEALGMTRQRGFKGIVSRVKRAVRHSAPPTGL